MYNAKKMFAFKSIQDAFKKRSKPFKTVRDYVTFYVKRRDFQDLKRHDFVILQGKALQVVKKRSEALRGAKKHSDWKQNRSRAVFSFKTVKN